MFERLKSRIDTETLVRGTVIPGIVALFGFVIYMATRNSDSPPPANHGNPVVTKEEHPVVTKPAQDSQNPRRRGDVNSSFWIDDEDNTIDTIIRPRWRDETLQLSPAEQAFHKSLEGLPDEEKMRRLKEHIEELERKINK